MERKPHDEKLLPPSSDKASSHDSLGDNNRLDRIFHPRQNEMGRYTYSDHDIHILSSSLPSPKAVMRYVAMENVSSERSVLVVFFEYIRAQSENWGDLIQGNHILKKRFIPVHLN